MTQNVFVMSQHQDGTNIRGPFNAGTLLYMLENGQIDRNTSLIKQYGAPGTTEFWQPISDDIERDLHNQNHLGVINAGHQIQNQNQSPGAEKGINTGLLEQYDETKPKPKSKPKTKTKTNTKTKTKTKHNKTKPILRYMDDNHKMYIQNTYYTAAEDEIPNVCHRSVKII